jgi:hypothetical protein
VQGVFINEPSAVVEWAKKLLKKLVGGKWRALSDAIGHADALLDKYDQENLVWERIELSSMLRRKENGDALSSEDTQRLQELTKRFKVVFDKDTNKKGAKQFDGELCNKDLIGDIRHLHIKDWTRKWAALIIILKLLKRFAAGWENKMPFEEVSEAEVYLALCPVARRPLILPFSEHSGRSIASHLKDVDKAIDFKVKNVLSGRGLSVSDRTLLKHVATTMGLGRELWKKFPRIGKIVRGEAGNA